MAIASAAEAMSTGQMLLCAANTLFDKVLSMSSEAVLILLGRAVMSAVFFLLNWGKTKSSSRSVPTEYMSQRCMLH